MISLQMKLDARSLAVGSALDSQLDLSFRPLSNLQLDLEPQLGFDRGEPRWTWHAATQTDPSAPYFFGTLLAATAGATLRATYTFTPRITLQAFTQLFVESGHYRDFASVPRIAGAQIHIADLVPLPAGAGPTDADFEQAALNANVLLRWDYRLGSTLFLVYSRSQLPDVTLLAGERATLRADAIRRVPAVDVILLKLSLWWAS